MMLPFASCTLHAGLRGLNLCPEYLFWQQFWVILRKSIGLQILSPPYAVFLCLVRTHLCHQGRLHQLLELHFVAQPLAERREGRLEEGWVLRQHFPVCRKSVALDDDDDVAVPEHVFAHRQRLASQGDRILVVSVGLGVPLTHPWSQEIRTFYFPIHSLTLVFHQNSRSTQAVLWVVQLLPGVWVISRLDLVFFSERGLQVRPGRHQNAEERWDGFISSSWGRRTPTIKVKRFARQQHLITYFFPSATMYVTLARSRKEQRDTMFGARGKRGFLINRRGPLSVTRSMWHTAVTNVVAERASTASEARCLRGFPLQLLFSSMVSLQGCSRPRFSQLFLELCHQIFPCFFCLWNKECK